MKTLALCAVLCAVLFAQSSNLENRNASSFTVNTGADATVGLQVLQHSATQSANLQNWSDSSGTPLTSVGPSGLITGPSGAGGSQQLSDFKVTRTTATRLDISAGAFDTGVFNAGHVDISAGVGTGDVLFIYVGNGAIHVAPGPTIDVSKVAVTGVDMVLDPNLVLYTTGSPIGITLAVWVITADQFDPLSLNGDTRSFVSTILNIEAGNGVTIVGDSQPGIVNISVTSPFPNGSLAFAGLGTPANGIQTYCSDCTVTSGIDNTCANTGTGAMAFRINGAWKCVQ